MDKRRNNKGTKGNKGGRPSKAAELKLSEIGTAAIVESYGSVEKYWRHIADQSKDSVPHLKMITEYVYGKPTEHKVIDMDNEITISFED